MTIDNFYKIEKLLEFNNSNEFYFLQIIQRKKDGNETGRGNNGARLIKAYYIFNKEELISRRDKIIELCKANNARAYIHLNRRNSQELALYAIEQYTKLIRENNTYQGTRVWDHICGMYKATGYKSNWIIDVDTKEEDILNKTMEVVLSCRGAGKIIDVIPTLHGYHIIANGFQVDQFKQLLVINKLPDMDIQKENPTLLYYSEPIMA